MTGVALACATPSPEVDLIAHRAGMIPGVPENSLAAIRTAITTGVDAIEIDLRRTRDRQIVVIHDRTLTRTTKGWGPVQWQTFDSIRDIPFRAPENDAAAIQASIQNVHHPASTQSPRSHSRSMRSRRRGARWMSSTSAESVPSYAEVLDLVASSPLELVLDVKQSLPVRDVVRALRSRDLLERTIIGTRSVAALERYRSAAPEARLLAFARSLRDIERLIASGADIVRLKPRWLRQQNHLVADIHARHRAVWVTAGDPDQNTLCGFATSNVDGILIDRPDRIVLTR